MPRWIFRVLAFTALCVVPLRAQSAQAPLRFAVSESWTAQVFHIVDQLAEWDSRTHRSYVRWAERTQFLDSTDRALLGRHAQLRRVRGWGQGIEQTFLVNTDIRGAAAAGVSRGFLSRRDAAVEVEVLEHFSRRLAPLRSESMSRVHEFAERVHADADSITRTLDPLARMVRRKRGETVQLFVVANPEPGSRGGRFVAQRLIVEVPERPDAMQSLYHEALHVLFAPHAKQLRSLAAQTTLSYDELNEAIAYAFAPGLTAGDDDPLARALEAAMKGPRSKLTMVYMAALRIRPVLRQALERGDSLEAFLASAGEALHSASLF